MDCFNNIGGGGRRLKDSQNLRNVKSENETIINVNFQDAEREEHNVIT